MTPMIEVAGRLVTGYEFSILQELADEIPGVPDGESARSIAVNVGPDGWTVLRTLTSLKARGLVERYDVDDLLVWRLTRDGRRPFCKSE